MPRENVVPCGLDLSSSLIFRQAVPKLLPSYSFPHFICNFQKTGFSFSLNLYMYSRRISYLSGAFFLLNVLSVDMILKMKVNRARDKIELGKQKGSNLCLCSWICIGHRSAFNHSCLFHKGSKPGLVRI